MGAAYRLLSASVNRRTNVVVCASLFAALIGIAILGDVLQAAGVEYILLNGGGTSRQNLQRFAKEVMPHFQTQTSSRIAAAE